MIKLCGMEFKSDMDMLEFIEDKLYWLNTHNKNYTKEQEFLIGMLFDVIHAYKKLSKEKNND